MEAIKKLLKSLHCPLVGSLPRLGEERAVQAQVVRWLEDRCIRHLEITDREIILTLNEDWSQFIGRYLHELGCPYEWQEQGEGALGVSSCRALLWLVQYAVKLQFEEQAESMMLVEEEEQVETGGDVNTDDDEIWRRVQEIGEEMLGVTAAPEEPLFSYLQRIQKKIQAVLDDLDRMEAKSEVPLSAFPLGFSTGGESVGRCGLHMPI
jgi:hypothetical protein